MMNPPFHFRVAQKSRNATMKPQPMKCSLVFCLVFGLLPLVASAETSLYISPSGNDGWLDEKNRPLASLKGAQIKVREQIARGLSGPVTVWIRGGEYEMTETVVLKPEDSGTEAFPITYQAYEGEDPVFTGGKKLTGWKPVETDPEGVSGAANGKLWYWKMPAGLKGKWRVTSPNNRTTLMPRAESPNFKVSKDHVADIEIFTRPKHGWLVNLLPLESIDVGTKTAVLAVDPTYGLRPSNAYTVKNNYTHNTMGFIRLDDNSGYTHIRKNVFVGGLSMQQIKWDCEYPHHFAINVKNVMGRPWHPTHQQKMVFYNDQDPDAKLVSRRTNTKREWIEEWSGKGAERLNVGFTECSNSLFYINKRENEFITGRDYMPENRKGGAEFGLIFGDPLLDKGFREKNLPLQARIACSENGYRADRSKRSRQHSGSMREAYAMMSESNENL